MWLSTAPSSLKVAPWQGQTSLAASAARSSRQPWWVQIPDTALSWPSARSMKPVSALAVKLRTAPSGRSALAATVSQVPSPGVSVSAAEDAGAMVRVSTLSIPAPVVIVPTTAATRSTARRPAMARRGAGGSSSAASFLCSAVTKSSAGAPLPGRAVRSAIATRARSVSSPVTQNRRGRRERTRSSTYRVMPRMIITPVRPLPRRPGAAPGAGAPWRSRR
jgi:hypothetical protein